MEVQNEMMVLALKEVNYFERLVEDLLLLAQVKDPSYHSSYPLINLSDILSEVAEDFAIRSQHKKQQIALKTNIENQSTKMHGDAHLITRLLRNGLENAFSFAHSSVSISARLDADKKIRILVDDDGPGFSQEALMDFGIRRTTRKLENKSDGRLSVGLGSVVMKTIAEAAGGEVKVSNRCENGRILGARVEIALPGLV